MDAAACERDAMSEVPPATAVAREIGAKFNAMMRKGGRIDQILAGGVIARPAKLPDQETERILHNLEVGLREYREEMTAALAWHRDWKRRHQPKGFKIKRKLGV